MPSLLLGPIVGHTDTRTTRVWIRVDDDPAHYKLRVRGVGSVPFVALEAVPEFGTAQARIDGLAADTEYRYQVLRHGRVLPGAHGRVRTMPDPVSMAPVQFVFMSCNAQEGDGAWKLLAKQVAKARPHFMVMMGDQVYVDQDAGVWKSHIDKPQAVRRAAIAAKYQDNWSRPLLRQVMANVPTYMVWDDHEIRDGWGSWAPDSPTMAERHRRGRKLFERHDAFFRDARDVYLQFQMAHNPTAQRPQGAERLAMPFLVRCGRMALLVLDGRGERDVFRKAMPVLGAAQWQFIDETIQALDAGIDALAIVTGAPIAVMSPRSLGHLALGRLQPDVRLFRRGDRNRLDALVNDGGVRLPHTAVGAAARNGLREKTLHALRGVIDEVRDQWSHHASRPEQERLLRAAATASRINREGLPPRAVSFLGGDIHMAARYNLTVRKPRAKLELAVSSGISQISKKLKDGPVTVDRDFGVAKGIRAQRTLFMQKHNFGWFEMVPTGGTPKTLATIVHEGLARGISGQWGRRSG